MRRTAGILFLLFFAISTSVYASESIISPLSDSHIQEYVPPIAKIPAALTGQSSLLSAVSSFVQPTPTPTPSPLLTPTPTPKKTRKPAMTVSLLGDSMMDTLGPDGSGLAERLKRVYPDTTITVINHGTGGVNIDAGLLHLTNGYSYLGATRPSVLSQTPDVLVVESFGYNPYPTADGALLTHWLKLAAVVDTVRAASPGTKILLAATIAPNWNVFGDGAPFLHFSDQGKREKVAEIGRYIDNIIKFSQSQHLPLADSYTKTKDSEGNGMIRYINPSDHIHYSDQGRALMSKTIAEAIIANRLLE